MLTGTLAPIKRAAFFFGFMGLAVAGMTAGSGLQAVTDQSSTTIAQSRGQATPTDLRFAAVDRADRVTSTAKRAIGTSQEARLVTERSSTLR